MSDFPQEPPAEGPRPQDPSWGQPPPPSEPFEEYSPPTEGLDPFSGAGDSSSKVRRIAAIGIPFIVLAAGIAFFVFRGDDDSRTINGTFTLTDTSNVVGGPTTCSGSGGYDDFGPGMDVTIKDGKGEIIASGRTENITVDYLSSGESEAAELLADGESDDDSVSEEELLDLMFEVLGCTVMFETDVPVVDFYEISVGRRGELSYSYSEIEAMDWRVSLSLG